MILILVSFEEMEHAKKAANHLIDSKLAACVEIYPVTNFYMWNGKKTEAQEISGVIKTEDGFFEKVQEALQTILPYDTPQIIKLDATASESYAKWVKESVS